VPSPLPEGPRSTCFASLLKLLPTLFPFWLAVGSFQLRSETERLYLTCATHRSRVPRVRSLPFQTHPVEMISVIGIILTRSVGGLCVPPFWEVVLRRFERAEQTNRPSTNSSSRRSPPPSRGTSSFSSKLTIDLNIDDERERVIAARSPMSGVNMEMLFVRGHSCCRPLCPPTLNREQRVRLYGLDHDDKGSSSERVQ
jgi:hypothetical protein